MGNGLVGGLVAVGVVTVLAMWARSRQAPMDPTGSVAPQPEREPWRAAADPDDTGSASGSAMEDADDEADAGEDQVIAVTSDGAAFVPHQHAIRLVPPEEQGEEWKVGANIKARNVRGEQALGMSWHAAEFTGMRVVRGDASEGAWILEALGRDGEYITFDFETREGADAAQRLFETHGIVLLGEDEDGRAMPPSAEQFAEARRVYKETEAALDLPDEEELR